MIWHCMQIVSLSLHFSVLYENTSSESQLAIATNGDEDSQFLRLYDMACATGEQSIATVKMPESRRQDLEELEINKTSFSPDGILLAVAQNDNTVLVYETQYMDRELYQLRHSGEAVSFKQEREYGMTAAIWQEGIGGRGSGIGHLEH